MRYYEKTLISIEKFHKSKAVRDEKRNPHGKHVKRVTPEPSKEAEVPAGEKKKSNSRLEGEARALWDEFDVDQSGWIDAEEVNA